VQQPKEGPKLPAATVEVMTASLLTGDVLLVEDDIIIAMEAEYGLLSLGAAKCHLAESVAAAIDLIHSTNPTFALLDVRLGNENSEAVAAMLLKRGVPFVVASGYGPADVTLAALTSAPSVTKPYTRAQLVEAIARAQRTYG
jgi:DNA-binding NtrC family response regulator